jgi:hypothetical protein
VRLTAARRTEQEHIRFRELNLVAAAEGTGLLILDAAIVVVDRNGENPLGMVLPYDVLVEECRDLSWAREVLKGNFRRFGQLLFDDLVAEIDAFVAYVYAGPSDKFLDLLLRLAAKRALQ